MAILELRAARNWSRQETANAFNLTAVLVQRLLRCTDGTENGLYSRIIPHFCGIKPELFLENLMPPCFSEFPSVDASTLFRRFATIENCSKSARIP
jgi:hypothetical protein